MKIAIVSILLLSVATTFAFAGFNVYKGEDNNTQGRCPGTSDNNAVRAIPEALRVNTNAAFDTFRSQFTGTLHVENFESFGAGNQPNALTFLDSSNLPIIAELTCDSSFPCSYQVKADATSSTGCPSVNGRYPIDGAKWLDLEATEGFNVTFSEGVRGFGFHATDVGDVNGVLELECVNGEVTSFEVHGSGEKSGNALFFGLISDTLDDQQWCKSFRYKKFLPNGQVTNDGFGFDKFVVLLPTNQVTTCDCKIVNVPCDNAELLDAENCACIRWAHDPSRPGCDVLGFAC